MGIQGNTSLMLLDTPLIIPTMNDSPPLKNQYEAAPNSPASSLAMHGEDAMR